MIAYPSFPDLVAEIIRAAGSMFPGMALPEALMIVVALGISVVWSAWFTAVGGNFVMTVFGAVMTLFGAVAFVVVLSGLVVQMATGGMAEPTTLTDTAMVGAVAVLVPLVGLKARRMAMDRWADR